MLPGGNAAIHQAVHTAGKCDDHALAVNELPECEDGYINAMMAQHLAAAEQNLHQNPQSEDISVAQRPLGLNHA